MSHLIEGFLFSNFKLKQVKSYDEENYQYQQAQRAQYFSVKRSTKRIYKKFQQVPCALTQQIQQYVNHFLKYQRYTLNIYKRKDRHKRFWYQGVVIQNQNIFKIENKQKRILFGKQLIKNKIQTNIKYGICFNTGQIKLRWPQIYFKKQTQTQQDQKDQTKNYIFIYNQFKQFFTEQLAPLIDKIIYSKNDDIIYCMKYYNQFTNRQEFQERTPEKLQKIQKYLYMSTIIDNFNKDKQAYKNFQEKYSKQQQSLIKVQNRIDKEFGKIGNQLKLYCFNLVSHQKKKLTKFGFLEINQRRFLQNYCTNSLTNKYQSQQQFMLNIIGIKKVQNKRKFIASGGSSSIFMLKISFQYIFSADPHYWIEQNKKTSNNVVQKYFAVKQIKNGNIDKIDHQHQIIKKIKGGFTIFLPRYYKIENIQAQYLQLKNPEVILMDYIKGQTLKSYVDTNYATLSFWTKLFLVKNILGGLKFLRDYKIVHLDLKPNNVLVTYQLLTKLIDFGQSYHPNVCSQKFKPGVTLPFCCPEIFGCKSNYQLKNKDQKKYCLSFDQKSDVFSLGIIMYQLFLRNNIFQMRSQKLYKKYQNKSYPNYIFICAQSHQDSNIIPLINFIMALVVRCISPDPQLRPTLNWISIIVGFLLLFFKGK